MKTIKKSGKPHVKKSKKGGESIFGERNNSNVTPQETARIIRKAQGDLKCSLENYQRFRELSVEVLRQKKKIMKAKNKLRSGNGGSQTQKALNEYEYELTILQEEYDSLLPKCSRRSVSVGGKSRKKRGGKSRKKSGGKSKKKRDGKSKIKKGGKSKIKKGGKSKKKKGGKSK